MGPATRWTWAGSSRSIARRVSIRDEVEAGVLLDGALDDVLRMLNPRDRVLDLFAEYGERSVRSELKTLVSAELPALPADLFTSWLDQWVRDAHEIIRRFRTSIAKIERFDPVGSDVLSVGWQRSRGRPCRGCRSPTRD